MTASPQGIAHRRVGFTMVECIVAGALLGVISIASLSSFLYVQRSQRFQSVQSELDIDARRAVERLRRDLWRTSRDRIVLHPTGTGPYSAISFPLLNHLDPDQPIPKDGNGLILWDSTVIYHFWEGDSPELRVTTFSPHVQLDDEQYVEQLAHVVRDGHGGNTHNGRNATTRTVIRNLVDWQLDIIRSRFDAYAPEPGRQSTIALGSALLSPGIQHYTFRVADRNPASSGFRFGIDTLTVSPTASRREAEAQFPLHHHSGGFPQIIYLPDGTWSGRYRLDYVAGGTGAELTLAMSHDRWEERNFMATGVMLQEAEIAFDTDLSPHAYVVRLPGNDKVWEAVDQTGDTTGVGQTESEMSNTAVRVLLQGNEILDGGFINFNGQNAWVGFRSTGPDGNQRLRIAGAFIAEADPLNPMNYLPDTRQNIRFNGASSFVIMDREEHNSGQEKSDLIDIAIEQDKSYIVGFEVRHPGMPPHGNAWVWTAPEGSAPSSFVIWNSADAALYWDTPAWSGLPPNEEGQARFTPSLSVFGLEYVFAGHPEEGGYTSPVFDTHVDAPNYGALTWSADTPDESEVEIRVRSGSLPDLSDALEWDTVATRFSGQTLHIEGRYVQVQARLLSGTDSLVTPKLKHFMIDWIGETRIVDIAGAFSTGPDHGIIELLVNDAPLFQGVTVNLSVYKDVETGRGDRKRLTSSVLTEMIPRNTGK